MIEKFCIQIIQQLGATGLLVVGLYFVLGKHICKIAGHIEVMNHNSAKLLERIDSSVDRICDKLDGHN